jgi:hypothetical protein
MLILTMLRHLAIISARVVFPVLGRPMTNILGTKLRSCGTPLFVKCFLGSN